MEVVLISGANEGIGFYMVSQLLKDGKQVAVLDINTSNLEQLKREYKDKIVYFTCDIADAELVKELTSEVNQFFGSIDYVIHNACKCLFTDFEKTSKDNFESVYNVNFYGAINLTNAVLPIMKKQKQGKIIFTGSGVGITGFKNISAYASSKAAIECLAKCLNIEYQSIGITFHVMHPPLTKTSSCNPLPVPNEFKADPVKVGIGLAKNIDKKSFFICHSLIQPIQVRLAYLFPIKLGKIMSKMACNYMKKL
ncbi:SDR family NAD(P)-dependent oxidoreductase [Candidatus Contubernalis alkaliaceticus]|uniref:SDR family NAD(P)-dependent oxidoreductase n=1 Tax=Candidatus Contubernalis alkaliaceticus TaxID=338645 RepID=UPI001F4C3F3C|nr:SDR family NAD(P)-dependent oxidoreductase [Candidatus Contubernalis alkalaceticus]UNC93209.1 SDR family NAD(P)-dependent oxidoreductase [Candidatus Contubernalis alkalaceticus]